MFLAPWTDMIEKNFPGVRLFSDMAKSKQAFFNGRGYTSIARYYVYSADSMLEICLGQADEMSCLKAADQMRETFRDAPGTSVVIEQVHQMKILLPAFSESWEIYKMIDSLFGF
jgi:sugar diacid utilization regulator